MSKFIDFINDHKADFAAMTVVFWINVAVYHLIAHADNAQVHLVPAAESTAERVAPEAKETQSTERNGPSPTELREYSKLVTAYKTCDAKLQAIRKNADLRWVGYTQMKAKCNAAMNEGSAQRLCALAEKQRASFDKIAAQANFTCSPPVPPG